MAKPVSSQDHTSPWVTASPQALPALEKIIGPSCYRAREGVNTGGANGVYYLELQGPAGRGGLVKVTNLITGVKRSVPKVEACLEGDLIYPLLRGRDIVRWHGEPGAYILLPHREGERLQAIPEAEMAHYFPNTARYLQQFAPILKERRTRVVRSLMARGPYYSIYGIGDYTFAPYKVVWLRIGTKITAAVVSRKGGGTFTQELIIPNDSTVFVPFDREDEAHYFCALLNSTPAQFVVRTTSVLATGSFASPHILEKIAIPQFDPANSLHRELAVSPICPRQFPPPGTGCSRPGGGCRGPAAGENGGPGGGDPCQGGGIVAPDGEGTGPHKGRTKAVVSIGSLLPGKSMGKR